MNALRKYTDLQAVRQSTPLSGAVLMSLYVSSPLRGDWVCSLCRDVQRPEVEYDCENTRLSVDPAGKVGMSGLADCDQRVGGQALGVDTPRSLLSRRLPQLHVNTYYSQRLIS